MKSNTVSYGAAVFCIAFFAGNQPSSHAQPTPLIPLTVANNLSGNAFRLPQDLPAHAILIVEFSEKSAGQSSACGKTLMKSLPQPLNASVFQLPVLEAVPTLLRSFVVRSIRKSIPEPLHPTSIPIFSHEAEWKRLTAFSSPDDAYLLLAGRAGEVLWHGHGPCNAETVKLLTAEVERDKSSRNEH